MKTITFAVQKGGTGKTSTAVSIAVELANKGKKVIIIDADPQGNATTWIDIDQIDYELADYLMKKCELNQVIKPTKIENLFVIPTASVDGSLKIYSSTLANNSPYAIKHLLRNLEDFEYCIIDTSPAFGALEESCLLASDEAISVLRLDDFSRDGLITFLNNIENMKERFDADNPKLNKLVLNARDLRVIQQTEYLEDISSSTKAQIFVIPVDQTFTKAQKYHYPIQMLEGTKKQTLEVLASLAEAIQE
ncbi:MAG: AAA family ATPase [Treponema sp.]|uniref:ParA family protein n=1 Tax=Treponema sp. TaxID=166 RepID=UPI00298DB983|nr:AAA family ATPase [Treponema sp.]MCQ2596582.1 AAA family ATPase [Treponema sp.]MCQ2601603.1 AAA family ATPase [Treponema sp.]